MRGVGKDGRSSSVSWLWRRKPTAKDEWHRYRESYRLYLLSQQGCTISTTDTYVYLVGGFCRWCQEHHIPFLRATHTHLVAYFAESLSKRSRSTAVNRMPALRSFFRWNVEEGRRSGDPTKGLSARRPKLQPPRPYTQSELRALLEACLVHRDRALLLLFIGSACRREEIMKLKGVDIDWRRGELRILGKGQKERRVSPGRVAMEALRRHVNGQSGPIWWTQGGDPMTGHRAYLNLQKIAKRAGVSQATIHRFRVTTVNAWLELGMALDEAQLLLGHSEIKTTARYASYTVGRRALDTQRRLSLADRIGA